MRSAILAVRADAGSEVATMITSLNQDFVEFKAALELKDKELAAQFDDIITTEKIEKIDASISDMQAAIDQANASLAAIQLGAGSGGPGLELNEDEVKYAATFDEFFRTGDNERDVKAALSTGNIRASGSVGTDADGGYTVPIEWDRTITDALVEVSAMRQFASVQSVSGQGFKKLYNIRGTTSGWVGETDGRPSTNTSGFKEYAFAFGEIYANPGATQSILDDSEIDFAAWMASEVETEFSLQEGAAFVDGDGVNKPKGVLKFTEADEAALAVNLRHPLGFIAEVNSGSAAAITSDGLVDLSSDLPTERMLGAAFYANRQTISTIRKMKDGDGNYLWQPSYQVGDPAVVLGHAIRQLSGLANIAADAIPILFGNMERTYRIFDRVGVRILRDPYSNKPYVHFYTTKRVGGGLWNPEWMRYHKVSAA
ncbi:MAG: phage major capsid protein [Rhodobacteraceae bacterium]|nr:phage major capsid protein [Paracoccaceae bacterium]